LFENTPAHLIDVMVVADMVDPVLSRLTLVSLVLPNTVGRCMALVALLVVLINPSRISRDPAD